MALEQFFFQTYWEIIKQDVFKAVLQFFTTGWLLPNFNSNIIAFIPKTNNADTVEQFRLSSIMSGITLVQQRGFIKGRSIKIACV